MRLLGFCFVGSCMEIQLLGSDSVHQNLLSVDDINPFGQLVRDSLGRGVLEQQISWPMGQNGCFSARKTPIRLPIGHFGC